MIKKNKSKQSELASLLIGRLKMACFPTSLCAVNTYPSNDQQRKALLLTACRCFRLELKICDVRREFRPKIIVESNRLRPSLLPLSALAKDQQPLIIRLHLSLSQPGNDKPFSSPFCTSSVEKLIMWKRSSLRRRNPVT
jgi:hypothetical protein